MDRAQAHHPPCPDRGWRSSCCRLGTRDVGGCKEGTQGTPESGGRGAALPVSPIETAGPGIPLIVSKDTGRETAELILKVYADRGQSPKPEGCLPCWELCCLRGDEAEGPGELCAPGLGSRAGLCQGPLSREAGPQKRPCLRPDPQSPRASWGALGAEWTPPGPRLLQHKEQWWRERGNGQARDRRGAEARSGLAGSGRADGRLSCQGPRLAVQTASFLYGNEEFRLMELNHL